MVLGSHILEPEFSPQLVSFSHCRSDAAGPLPPLRHPPTHSDLKQRSFILRQVWVRWDAPISASGLQFAAPGVGSMFCDQCNFTELYTQEDLARGL